VAGENPGNEAACSRTCTCTAIIPCSRARPPRRLCARGRRSWVSKRSRLRTRTGSTAPSSFWKRPRRTACVRSWARSSPRPCRPGRANPRPWSCPWMPPAFRSCAGSSAAASSGRILSWPGRWRVRVRMSPFSLRIWGWRARWRPGAETAACTWNWWTPPSARTRERFRWRPRPPAWPAWPWWRATRCASPGRTSTRRTAPSARSAWVPRWPRSAAGMRPARRPI